MATQSPVKKQKTTNPPIVFTSPSLSPDVRIQLFHDWEFHVHSVVLKFHAAFFRKFLDSADKVHSNTAESSVSSPTVTPDSRGGSVSASGGCFRYELVTQIHEDGIGWYLVEKGRAIAERQEMSHYKGTQMTEKNTFETMLKAIYSENVPLASASLDELENMTAMADYYGALRMVSRAVDAGLLENSNLGQELQEEPCRGLILATTLRNKTLFTDSLILCLGPWSKPTFREGGLENHPKLFALAKAAHLIIHLRLASVYYELLNYASTAPYEHWQDVIDAKDIGEALISAANRARESGARDHVQLPLYYRCLKDSLSGNSELGWAAKVCILPLLVNHLLLNKRANAGKQGFEDYFLMKHANGSEYEFPWDTTETDW